MNLTIDIGNTAAKFCVFECDRLVEELQADVLSLEGLRDFCRKHRPERGILSSVRPLSADARRELALLPCKLERLQYDTPLPIVCDYETPETLGADRIAAAVGAWTLARGCNILIVDAGTCLTLDLLREDGHYIGGNIAPGLRMRLAAMHEFTQGLPLVSADGPVPLPGYSTETAMRSGALRGMVGEITQTATALCEQYPGLRLFITGGDAQRLGSFVPLPFTFEPHLAACGLNYILNNRKTP